MLNKQCLFNKIIVINKISTIKKRKLYIMSSVKSKIVQDMERQEYGTHTNMKTKTIKIGPEKNQSLELRDRVSGG